MRIQKVRQLMELLESCNPDADIFMTSGINEITDIISVDKPSSDFVIVRSDEGIYRRPAPIYPQVYSDESLVLNNLNTLEKKEIKMKKYRLKKEAVPFFADNLATAIHDWDVWKKYHVDDKAIEEVEDARIEYGVKTSASGATLGGWSEDDGQRLCFTIIFPSMKYQEHDAFSKGKIVRGLMNRLQSEVNRFVSEFYQGDLGNTI
ncbi:MAG: hypothetical protein RSO15_09830 [Bacteroides sp.]|uniref:hypothetical protein n=1 Tax=Bacteroides sp. TaxID=29523 RepID=UPI002FC95679